MLQAAIEYVAEDDAACGLVREAAELVLMQRPALKSWRLARRLLLERIGARGSRTVFAAAYKERRNAWCSYARSIMRIKDPAFSAEDLVNQAVTASWRARPDFTAIAAVNRYVRDAIRTTYGRWVAKLLQAPIPMMSLDDEVPLDPSDENPSPDRQAIHSERAERIRELLRQRTRPEELEAFVLFEVHRRKVPVIAKHQGVSRQTVYNRIGKVRRMVQSHLDGGSLR